MMNKQGKLDLGVLLNASLVIGIVVLLGMTVHFLVQLRKPAPIEVGHEREGAGERSVQGAAAPVRVMSQGMSTSRGARAEREQRKPLVDSEELVSQDVSFDEALNAQRQNQRRTLKEEASEAAVNDAGPRSLSLDREEIDALNKSGDMIF